MQPERTKVVDPTGGNKQGKCPTCHGKKTVEVTTHVKGKREVKKVKCPQCSGSGKSGRIMTK